MQTDKIFAESPLDRHLRARDNGPVLDVHAQPNCTNNSKDPQDYCFCCLQRRRSIAKQANSVNKGNAARDGHKKNEKNIVPVCAKRKRIVRHFVV